MPSPNRALVEMVTKTGVGSTASEDPACDSGSVLLLDPTVTTMMSVLSAFVLRSSFKVVLPISFSTCNGLAWLGS